MNIANHIISFTKTRRYHTGAYDQSTVKSLLTGDSNAALVNQEAYDESEYLAYNIRQSVSQYTRNKDVAIRIYKDFLKYLGSEGINVEVRFPPISISNSFERLMFIAKYLQDPRHNISDLADLLWVSQRTIEEDMKRLRGDHDDPIQICGKVFEITDLERRRDTVYFPSTAHPLFLTPNLTQVLVTLKGLKAMSADPVYAGYAFRTAADIWEQLSDYARNRIRYVLSELIPEDLTWYESLTKTDDRHFHSEYCCSVGKDLILDCLKNEKGFYLEYLDGDTTVILEKCRVVPGSLKDGGAEVITAQGVKLRIEYDSILKSGYTIEELM